mgnify:FL=1|jgi:hypothetical protein
MVIPKGTVDPLGLLAAQDKQNKQNQRSGTIVEVEKSSSSSNEEAGESNSDGGNDERIPKTETVV